MAIPLLPLDRRTAPATRRLRWLSVTSVTPYSAAVWPWMRPADGAPLALAGCSCIRKPGAYPSGWALSTQSAPHLAHQPTKAIPCLINRAHYLQGDTNAARFCRSDGCPRMGILAVMEGQPERPLVQNPASPVHAGPLRKGVLSCDGSPRLENASR